MMECCSSLDKAARPLFIDFILLMTATVTTAGCFVSFGLVGGAPSFYCAVAVMELPMELMSVTVTLPMVLASLLRLKSWV